jgi:hypothetical protein
MAQLFGGAKCTAEILAFLDTTELGLRGRLREDGPGGGEPGGSDLEHEDGPEEEARRTVGTGTGE